MDYPSMENQNQSEVSEEGFNTTDEKLIEAVRNFPCLWQMSSKSYKDIRAKENAWLSIAKEFDGSVEDCSNKWKCLRDRFVRELRKVTAGKSGSAGPPYLPTWHHYPALLFLRDSVRHRPTTTNLKLAKPATLSILSTFSSPSTSVVMEAEQESDETTNQAAADATPAPPVPQKRKTSADVNEAIINILNRLMESRTSRKQQDVPQDEEGLYAEHVAAIMRRFTTKQKAMAKLQIDQVLFNIEFPPDNES